MTISRRRCCNRNRGNFRKQQRQTVVFLLAAGLSIVLIGKFCPQCAGEIFFARTRCHHRPLPSSVANPTKPTAAAAKHDEAAVHLNLGIQGKMGQQWGSCGR